MNDALVEAVRRKLRVTYDDPDVNERIISEIIPAAEHDIMSLVGIQDQSFDFSKPGIESTLFLAWCFYEFNDAADDFEAHYAHLIARCREKWMVMQYVEEKDAAIL